MQLAKDMQYPYSVDCISTSILYDKCLTKLPNVT